MAQKKCNERKRRPSCCCKRGAVCWVCWSDPSKRLGRFYKTRRRRSPRPSADSRPAASPAEQTKEG